jgi:tRNA(Ile)-lysidine synthase
MKLSGGTKSLKKLFIDRKIPASQRDQIPVVYDDAGIIGVYGIGVNLDRAATSLPATQIKIQEINNSKLL